MSPKYKVIYFDGRGLAEPIRLLLTYLGEPFEDHRMVREDWPKIKPTTPFGKVPILEINGKQYSQSSAIYRYLGKVGNLGGSSDLEDLHIDIIADVLTDLRLEVGKVVWEADEDVKKTKTETLVKETVPFYYQKLEEIAKNNNGYLANKKLSWVDFMFASNAENNSFSLPQVDLLKNYPTLQALKNKILTNPKIKAYIDKRHQTPF